MKNLDLLIPKSAPSADSFTWATVVGTSPLSIRLDGDEDPLPFVPDCLYGPPVVGDRVWVQITGKRVIVTGANGDLDSGADGSDFAEFNFAIATSVWTCPHGFGKKGMPVMTFDANGDELVGDISYPDDDTVQVEWFYPTSGYCRITN